MTRTPRLGRFCQSLLHLVRAAWRESFKGPASNRIVFGRRFASHQPTEGKWQGNTCSECKVNLRGALPGSKSPRFPATADAVPRRRRFSIGKSQSPDLFWFGTPFAGGLHTTGCSTERSN